MNVLERGGPAIETKLEPKGCVLDVVRNVLALGGSLGWADSHSKRTKSEKITPCKLANWRRPYYLSQKLYAGNMCPIRIK